MSTVRTGRASKRPANGAYSVPSPTAAPTDFNVIDNHDDTYTVQALDANSNPQDLNPVATFVATSSAPSMLAVDKASSSTVRTHPLKVGNANLTIVVTYNNGRAGPFTITIPISVIGVPGVELISSVTGNITVVP